MTEELENVEARIDEIVKIREELDTPEQGSYRRRELYNRPNGFKYVMRHLGAIKSEEYYRRLRQRKRLQKGIRNWKSN